MNESDLTMLDATATYFERAAHDMRDRANGLRPTYNVLPLSAAYADGTARTIRAALRELRRLGAESKGNG